MSGSLDACDRSLDCSLSERGRTLPEADFTDPLDQAIGVILSKRLTSAELMQAIFRSAGFDAASGAHADDLAALAANHLETIRTNGPGAALAALEGRHP